MGKLGYIQNGLPEKELALQVNTLIGYGCDEIVLESESGMKLGRLLSYLESGMELVVYNLAALNKTADHLVIYISRLQKKGVQFHSIEENLSTKKEVSLDLVETLQLVADIHDAIALHEKENPRKQGRPTIELDVIEDIIYYHEKKAMSYRSISEKTNVSLGTVHKYIKQHSKQ